MKPVPLPVRPVSRQNRIINKTMISIIAVVTAVIVEGAIEQAKSDKEVQAAYEAQRLQKLMPELRLMFAALDEDESGDITKEELINGLDSDPSLKDELSGIRTTIVGIPTLSIYLP